MPTLSSPPPPSSFLPPLCQWDSDQATIWRFQPEMTVISSGRQMYQASTVFMHGWRTFPLHFTVIYDCSNLSKKINTTSTARGVGGDRGFIHALKNWACVKNPATIAHHVRHKLKCLALKHNVTECIIYKHVQDLSVNE